MLGWYVVTGLYQTAQSLPVLASVTVTVEHANCSTCHVASATQGAAEFREARKRAREGDSSQQQGPRRKQRGVAFGTGALDEDDTMGMMADYVDYSDDIRRAGGRSKGEFHFEVASEGEEEEDMPAIQPGCGPALWEL